MEPDVARRGFHLRPGEWSRLPAAAQPPRGNTSASSLAGNTAASAPSSVPGLVARLAEALRFRTVSPEGAAPVERREFLGLHQFLERSFPRAHAALRRETVGSLSLLFTWRGTNAEVPPILLSGHLDVVPVREGPGDGWTRRPFDGDVADGHVWGRGALDDKSATAGTLEAVEQLLAEGVRPRRTIYLALGHDEERGGLEGAAQIAAPA